jgi:hypothetical protein
VVDAAADVRQPPARGDQHDASGAARDQVAHLRPGRRVVQHDQRPAVGQQRAEQRRPFLAGLGHRVDVQRPQELRQHLGGFGRPLGRAVQLGPELAVRELPGPVMGRPQRERGLADPARAGHHQHRHPGPAQQPRHLGAQVGTSDIVGRGGR